MPVNSCHPEFEANIDLWRKCRDVISGEEVVKEAGIKYLPMLDGSEQVEYDAYKTRALFYSAADRTVKGLTGAIFRKPPKVEFPQKEYLKKIGVSGEAFEAMALELVREDVGIGRLGLYVDADENGQKPYVTKYYAEHIINWATEDDEDGREVLTMVVLEESHLEPKADDPYCRDTILKYRVLRINQSGAYEVEVFKKEEGSDGKEKFVSEGIVIPKMAGGRALSFIPFQFLNADSTDPCVTKSPILDLVNVNLSHYRTSADLEHGRHFTALPTAWVAGFDAKQTKLKIGSGTAWVSENAAAHAGFLEFTGAGLGHLKDALTHKEQLMAVLGARLLEEQKTGVESAEAMQMRTAGEGSILSGIAKTCSKALTTVLGWVADWMAAGSGAKVSVELNTEFASFTIDAQTINALMLACQGNMMSWEVFFYNLKKSEFIPDDRTEEQEKAAIQAGLPVQPVGMITDSTDPNNPAPGSPKPTPTPKPTPKPEPKPTA